MSLSRFASLVALVFHVLTGRSIQPGELISYPYDFDEADEEIAFAPAEEIHNAQAFEYQLFSRIMFGQPIEKAFDPSQVQGINEGTLSFSPIHHRRYMMISSVTLAARYAVSGGMDYSLAMSIADGYIQLLDQTNDVVKMLQIGNDMFRTYSTMVAELQLNHPQSMLIYRVQRCVLSHLNERLSVQGVAEQLGLSRTYLSAQFKAVTGKNLSDFILEHKINQAKVLLKTTDLSISEIAARLAYSSQSHFQVSFHKAAGITPKEYRQAQQRPFEG